MAVLQQCPQCHRRWSLEKSPKGQKVRRDECDKCGYDLGGGRKSQKVPFFVIYRISEDGQRKQRAEFAGFKLKDARVSDGKRGGQVKENRILEIQPEYNETWNELAAEFLALEDVKEMPSYNRIKNAVGRFVDAHGELKIRDFKPQHLEDWQRTLLGDYTPASVHQDRLWVQKMVNWADDNDKIYPKVPKVFRKAKRIFKVGENARERVLGVGEYLKLLAVSPEHLQDVLTVAYNTGMRSREYFKLKWEFIDLKAGFIRLSAEVVKTRKPRAIPINHHVRAVLERLPRGLPGTPVFRYRGKVLADRVTRSLRSSCKEAGILYGQKIEGGFCFRDIRASVKTNMLHAGADETMRDILLGHAKKGMDVHYLRIKDEDLVAAMDKYTSWLDHELEKVRKSVVKSVVKCQNLPFSEGASLP
jgi:integrase